ncbi:hypothetical protein Tco_0027185 [Tanacetum coccineum]
MSVSKKKAPAKVARSKGIELLSDVALLEEAQLKKALNRSKRETTIHQAGGSSEGTDSESEFLMSQKGDSGDEANEQGNDEVDKQSDDDHEQADDERTESNDEEEETQDDEYIHTLDDYVPTDDETNDESDDVTEEEYGRINEELYGDINVSLTDVEPANKEKDDKEMIVAGHMNVNQEGAGNQVKDDAQATRKTEGPIPSSSISSDYAAKYLNFDNIPPVDTKVVSMLDINVQHEVPRTSPFLTIPSLLFPHLQQLTLIPTPTTTEATTSTTAISESETLVALQLRITNLEKDIKELKTIDHSTSLLSTIKSKVPNAVKEYLGISMDDALYKVLKKHDADIIKEHSIPAEIVERLRQQYVPKKSIEDIRKIKMEHARKQQEPKETITSSDTSALKEFDKKKTLFQTMTNSKSFNRNPKQRALYHALMESKLEDEDAMNEGVVDKLKKRKKDDADKDEGPFAKSDRGLKRQKTSKDTKPSKKAKSTETSKGTFKGTSKSQPKSTDKSAQAEETAAPKHDWFKKPKRPLTPNSDWNVRKSVDFRPPQTWISKIAQAKKPPLSFDELMSTPIDFSAYVMNHLKIDNLTQEHLVGPAFNLLKGTCKSLVELKYNIEERYKAVTVVPIDYFINNDLEYLRGGSLSKKYTTSTTKTKDAKYDISGINDMVPSLWSLVKSTKRIIAVTKVKVMKWYDYGYLEEIKVRREYQQLYKFKEGDFPRLHLRDIEDMLLLVVQKKLSNLERDVIFDLGVALQMFTRRIVILKSDISNRISYTAYINPQGIIYVDKYKINRLMRSDKLYKFSDGTLTYVRNVLYDIASNMRIDYLPKRSWSSLDRKRSRIMIKAIDQLLLERRLMRSLEKFVGKRDYGEDLRLLERTI